MTADERLAAVLAVFAAPSVERLVRHAAGVDSAPALALARSSRRERLSALASAAHVPRSGAAARAATALERSAVRQFAAALDGGECSELPPPRRGGDVLRRLLLEQLVSR